MHFSGTYKDSKHEMVGYMTHVTIPKLYNTGTEYRNILIDCRSLLAYYFNLHTTTAIRFQGRVKPIGL